MLSSDQVPPEGKVDGTKKYWLYQKKNGSYHVKHEKKGYKGKGNSTNEAIRNAV